MLIRPSFTGLRLHGRTIIEGVMKGSKAFSGTALLLGISAAASASNLPDSGIRWQL